MSTLDPVTQAIADRLKALEDQVALLTKVQANKLGSQSTPVYTGLTAGRVVIVGSDQSLADDDGLTYNATTNLLAAGGGFAAPRSSGSALFGIDGTVAGSGLTIANNGAAGAFGGVRNFSGLIIISETAVNGSCAVFLVEGSGVVVLIAQSATNYSTVAGTASKTNVYIPAGPGTLTIENKLGTTATYNVIAIRTRTI